MPINIKYQQLHVPLGRDSYFPIRDSSAMARTSRTGRGFRLQSRLESGQFASEREDRLLQPLPIVSSGSGIGWKAEEFASESDGPRLPPFFTAAPGTGTGWKSAQLVSEIDDPLLQPFSDELQTPVMAWSRPSRSPNPLRPPLPTYSSPIIRRWLGVAHTRAQIENVTHVNTLGRGRCAFALEVATLKWEGANAWFGLKQLLQFHGCVNSI